MAESGAGYSADTGDFGETTWGDSAFTLGGFTYAPVSAAPDHTALYIVGGVIALVAVLLVLRG